MVTVKPSTSMLSIAPFSPASSILAVYKCAIPYLVVRSVGRTSHVGAVLKLDLDTGKSKSVEVVSGKCLDALYVFIGKYRIGCVQIYGLVSDFIRDCLFRNCFFRSLSQLLPPLRVLPGSRNRELPLPVPATALELSRLPVPMHRRSLLAGVINSDYHCHGKQSGHRFSAAPDVWFLLEDISVPPLS